MDSRSLNPPSLLLEDIVSHFIELHACYCSVNDGGKSLGWIPDDETCLRFISYLLKLSYVHGLCTIFFYRNCLFLLSIILSFICQLRKFVVAQTSIVGVVFS